MSRDMLLELLVRNYFTKLANEVQLKMKESGKPSPKLYLTYGRAKGKACPCFEGNYARTEWLTGSEKLNWLFCWPCLFFDLSRRFLNNPCTVLLK